MADSRAALPLTASEHPSVLVIDDLALHREGLADLLRRDGWAGAIMTAADASSAIEQFTHQMPGKALLLVRTALYARLHCPRTSG